MQCPRAPVSGLHEGGNVSAAEILRGARCVHSRVRSSFRCGRKPRGSGTAIECQAPLFIAMRATDPLQDLLYFVRDPWSWGRPPEAAGIPGISRQQSGRRPARGARAARRAVKRIEVLNAIPADWLPSKTL